LSGLTSLQYLSLDGNPLYDKDTLDAVHKIGLDFTVDGIDYQVWGIKGRVLSGLSTLY
jgi:hypothetical protein